MGPEGTILLFAREGAGLDAINVQFGIGGERRNLTALPALGFKAPAMIGALHLLSVKVAVAERNAAMRTGIAHGESFACTFASQEEWDSQQHGRSHRVSAYRVAAQRRIPEPVEPWSRLTGPASNIQARTRLVLGSQFSVLRM